jgi:hypothetical protein
LASAFQPVQNALQTAATARVQARGGQQCHQRTGVQGAVPMYDFDKALSVLKSAIDARQAGDTKVSQAMKLATSIGPWAASRS